VTTKKKVVLLGTGAIFLLLLFLLVLGNVLPLGAIAAIIVAVLLTVAAGFFADAFLTFQHECSVEVSAESKQQFAQLVETHKKSLEDHSVRETAAQEQRLQQQLDKMLEVLRAQQEHPLTAIAETIQKLEAIEKKGVNDAQEIIDECGERIEKKIAEACEGQKELTDDMLGDFSRVLKNFIKEQKEASEKNFEELGKSFSQITGTIDQLSAAYQDFRENIKKQTDQNDFVFKQMRSLQQDDIKFLEKLIRD
jgi:F0F1-type ATP synthase membrane subunit b/b'